MGHPAGVKRDFKALERRRLRALRLLDKGLRQSEVARRLGVAQQSVSRWAQQAAQGGPRRCDILVAPGASRNSAPSS